MKSNEEILEEVERQINSYNKDIRSLRKSIDKKESAHYLHDTAETMKEYERLVQVLDNIKNYIIT